MVLTLVHPFPPWRYQAPASLIKCGVLAVLYPSDCRRLGFQGCEELTRLVAANPLLREGGDLTVEVMDMMNAMVPALRSKPQEEKKTKTEAQK